MRPQADEGPHCLVPRYVKNLKIGGSQGLGGTLEVTGEFVGTPSCQWYRVAADGKVAAIDGATELSRQVGRSCRRPRGIFSSFFGL